MALARCWFHACFSWREGFAIRLARSSRFEYRWELGDFRFFGQESSCLLRWFSGLTIAKKERRFVQSHEKDRIRSFLLKQLANWLKGVLLRGIRSAAARQQQCHVILQFRRTGPL